MRFRFSKSLLKAFPTVRHLCCLCPTLLLKTGKYINVKSFCFAKWRLGDCHCRLGKHFGSFNVFDHSKSADWKISDWCSKESVQRSPFCLRNYFWLPCFYLFIYLFRFRFLMIFLLPTWQTPRWSDHIQIISSLLADLKTSQSHPGATSSHPNDLPKFYFGSFSHGQSSKTRRE